MLAFGQVNFIVIFHWSHFISSVTTPHLELGIKKPGFWSESMETLWHLSARDDLWIISVYDAHISLCLMIGVGITSSVEVWVHILISLPGLPSAIEAYHITILCLWFPRPGVYRLDKGESRKSLPIEKVLSMKDHTGTRAPAANWLTFSPCPAPGLLHPMSSHFIFLGASIHVIRATR